MNDSPRETVFIPPSTPRVFLIRGSHLTEPIHAVQEPAVCFIAQGSKRVMAGKSVYSYGGGQYLIASVDVPIVGQLLEATRKAPFLRLRLDLDPAALGALMLETNLRVVGSDPGTGPALQ